MQKLRISYSLLNMWKRGQYDQAINSYLHRDQITSAAMEDGTIWDLHITEWVNLYKCLPEEFGGDKLINPLAQEKITVPYNEQCDLIILPDIIDETTLWENKTGDSKDSADYAQDFQIAIYFLGLENAHKVDKAIINHYDQYKNELDRTLIWNTKEERNRAKNFIDSLSPEIYEYFKEKGILDMQT
jgi:hypothetical protein